MHVAGANLDLVQLTPRTEDRRVQRLITVRFRLRDVVLDALLYRRPLIVDNAECMVAIGDAVDQDASRKEIVDFVVRALALLHLLVDRPEMRRTTRDVDVVNAGASERIVKRLTHLFN